MNYEELLESMLKDSISISNDFNYWDKKPRNFSTANYIITDHTRWINNQNLIEINILMVKGAKVAFDFMSFYWPVIQSDFEVIGEKHKVTNSHIATYVQSITSCIRPYLGFHCYPHAFAKGIYMEIKEKRTIFNKSKNQLLEQLAFEKRQELIHEIYKCDFMTFTLEYLYHNHLKFAEWYNLYYMERKYLNKQYHLGLISETIAKENFYSQLNGANPTTISMLKNRISKFNYSHF